MKKTDLTQIKLLLNETLEPIVKLVDRHESAIEDEQTGLKGRVQRQGERISELQQFKTEIKTKMAMISTLAGAIGSGAVLLARSLFNPK